ncbi:MAG: hypothetical protein ACI8UO_004581 [Verrucomicrobiales bacterium]
MDIYDSRFTQTHARISCIFKLQNSLDSLAKLTPGNLSKLLLPKQSPNRRAGDIERAADKAL